MKSLLVFLCCLPISMFAQQRFLVSPTDEVYRLRNGESASALIGRLTRSGTRAGLCDTLPASTQVGGFPESQYPSNSNVAVHHKDVVGEWYIAKAPGTIDTIFWENLGSVGAKDSLVEIHVNRSNIYPGHGPGFPPYLAPCALWGYYRNSNDLDRGITPYRNEATDTAWISTSFFDLQPSFDPLGEALWDGNGYKTIAHSEGINHLAMDEFGGDKPHINAGDRFFITFRVNSFNGHPYPPDPYTVFATSEFTVTTGDENYPTRDWVFFEHDSAPTMCGPIPGMFVRGGWIALGDESSDSLTVRMPNIWYSMTTDPYVPNAGDLYGTHAIVGDSLRICLNACDPSMVDTTNVTWIRLYTGYSIDSLSFPLTHSLPLCRTLPRLAESTMVCYDIHRRNSPAYASECFEILGVDDIPAPLPRSSALFQNYPNPFNPTTEIRFAIRDAGFVTLRVFDVLGREVATLVNERKSSGEYSITWNASHVQSGVYFYSLRAGSFLDVKKLVLVK